MQGLRPENLSNAELQRYASLYAPEKLPQSWLLEIARRFSGQKKDPSRR